MKTCQNYSSVQNVFGVQEVQVQKRKGLIKRDVLFLTSVSNYIHFNQNLCIFTFIFLQDLATSQIKVKIQMLVFTD